VSTADELAKLSDLFRAGVLTPEEFGAAQAKLLHADEPEPAGADGDAAGGVDAAASDDPADSGCVAGGAEQGEQRGDEGEPELSTWRAADSLTPGSSPASMSLKKKQVIGAGAAVIVIAVILTVVLLNQGTSPSPRIPGANGMTIAELQSNAKSNIIGPEPSGFGAKGVTSVICHPPTTWAPGKTFTCFAYGASGNGIGQYQGTVEPNSANGEQVWNAQWVPSG